ncbi:MAG: hypothetical protein AAGG53_03790 [Cyanobacteria bacterium P01_H01_bin.152]
MADEFDVCLGCWTDASAARPTRRLLTPIILSMHDVYVMARQELRR